MYDFSYSLQDFPWTRIPVDSYGPESWNLPDAGWFTFVPETWAACVYVCLLEVDTCLRKAGLVDSFVIHRVDIECGYLKVWYGFRAQHTPGCINACACDDAVLSTCDDEYDDMDARALDVQDLLYKIQDSFMRLQYLTSLIPSSVPARHDVLAYRELRDTVNMA